MNIIELEKEIEHQCRNGREQVYLKTEDLIALGINATTTVERCYVPVSMVESFITKYKKSHNTFKENLRQQAQGTKLVGRDETGFHFQPIQSSNRDER